MITDFKDVEQNFRNLTRTVQEAQLQQDVRKGAVVSRVLDAGEYIVQSNHRLTEKLRQMLDERNLMENRRVAELITDVQRLCVVDSA